VLYISAMRNAATAAGNLDSPVMAHSDTVNVPVRDLARNLWNEVHSEWLLRLPKELTDTVMLNATASTKTNKQETYESTIKKNALYTRQIYLFIYLLFPVPTAL